MAHHSFRRTIARLALLALTTAACGRDTPTGGDVVATAAGQSLTADVLSGAFGASTRSIRPEELRTAVELWIDYQLLAHAAASRDTLSDPAIVAAALWGPEANARAQKWYQRVQPTFPRDSTTAQSLYESGKLITAKQILLAVPMRVTTPQGYALRARLDSLRATLTPANFARIASRLSADSLSRKDGGQLPAWPPGRAIMLPAFEEAILKTKPGTISPILATEFGAHIIYRPTWTEAQSLVAPAARELAKFNAESTYFHRLLDAHTVTMVPNVAPLARAVAEQPERWADSSTVLATMTGGNFTASMLVRWLRAFPVTEGITGQLTMAPDTLVPNVLRRLIRNELFLRQADSAKVTLTADERTVLGGQLRAMIESTVGTLGIAARMIPDSVRAMPDAQREAFLTRKVRSQFAAIVQGTAAPVPVPPPVRALLRARYRDVSVDTDALRRALDDATRQRQTADSLRNNQRKDSAASAAAPPKA